MKDCCSSNENILFLLNWVCFDPVPKCPETFDPVPQCPSGLQSRTYLGFQFYQNYKCFGYLHHLYLLYIFIFRPQELDDAVRRRFVKRFYVPLPNQVGRKAIMLNCLKEHNHSLLDEHVEHISAKTDGEMFFGICNQHSCTI